jgi:hypothetical protein
MEPLSNVSMLDGSWLKNCCWPLPAQSFLFSDPVGLMTIFFVSFSVWLLLALLVKIQCKLIAVHNHCHGNML